MVLTDRAALITVHNEVAVLSLQTRYGSSDLDALTEIERSIREVIDGSECRLIIDMRDTAYIGCEFMNVLTRCQRHAHRKSQSITLCNLGQFASRVLMAARLDTVFEVHSTLQDAIAGRRISKTSAHQLVN